MSKILLANNEQGTSEILTKLLKTEGYKVVSTSVLSQAQELIETDDFNLMIASTSKAFDPELTLLQSARTHRPAMPIIVMKDHVDAATAALIDEHKPFAAVEKPLKVDRFLSAVQRAVDFNDSAVTENVNLNLQLEKIYQFKDIVAESPAMRSVCDMISRVSGIDVTILLAGESGTGKHTIAETIHLNSNRKDSPFMTVDCAAGDPETELFGQGATHGALELCNNGTICIREVGKLSPATQDKLRKVLADKSLRSIDRGDVSLNVRVVASTSDDLDQLVAAGRFKEDLYKILKIILIRIQPLRNRPQDIIPTVRRILQKKVGEGKTLPSMDTEVVDILQKHSWPGNVDEIGKVLDYALAHLVNNVIKKESIPADLSDKHKKI